jgi:hypothetical protein
MIAARPQPVTDRQSDRHPRRRGGASLPVRLGLDISPLRTSRDFRLVFTGAGVSAIGSYLTYISIPYQVYLLTHDPLLVGLLGLCEIAPLLFMAFVGGALARS